MGNKADLAEEEAVNCEEARIWAESIGAFYGKVSAKTAQGVEELFQRLVQKLEAGPSSDSNPRNTIRVTDAPGPSSGSSCKC